MFYFKKSLPHTKSNGYDTWVAPNSNGCAKRLCDAGVFTEEDKQLGKESVEYGNIEFIEITKEMIAQAKGQVNYEIEKLEIELESEQNKLKKVELMERKYIDN